MANRNSPLSLVGFLDVGVLTTLVVALLYTAGWSYAYHYFDRFHLGLLGLEIQRENFLLYGFQVLRERFFLVPLSLLCSGGLAFLALHFVQRRERRLTPEETEDGAGILRLRVVILLGGTGWLLLMFIVFYQLGTLTGNEIFEQEQKQDFPDYPRVKVWLKGEQNLMTKEWGKGCYRLLLHNKSQLYIFPADGISEKMPTEVIPNSRVDALRVLPLYRSSDECQE
ncbi:MAG: hypothetical protein D3903_05135 [Candidatus Electrothrix sp. GM3_4]|nr:hypothetical protein [Candidatus Electrothrix sp. GM3_4]